MCRRRSINFKDKFSPNKIFIVEETDKFCRVNCSNSQNKNHNEINMDVTDVINSFFSIN